MILFKTGFLKLRIDVKFSFSMIIISVTITYHVVFQVFDSAFCCQ